MLKFAPPQQCMLPLKFFSPFLTEMAKKARTAQTLNRIPTPSTYPQSEKIMQ